MLKSACRRWFARRGPSISRQAGRRAERHGASQSPGPRRTYAVAVAPSRWPSGTCPRRPNCHKLPHGPFSASQRLQPRQRKGPRFRGLHLKRTTGFEPATLSLGRTRGRSACPAVTLSGPFLHAPCRLPRVRQGQVGAGRPATNLATPAGARARRRGRRAVRGLGLRLRAWQSGDAGPAPPRGLV
jgi:hypothetical protein